MDMKKKIYILAVALVATFACMYANASSFLKVTYVTEEGLSSDNFSIEGGEVQILDNAVNVVYSGNPDLNKTYVFDDIRSLQFEIQTSTGNINSDIRLSVYTDARAGILYLCAKEPLGLVSIYSIAGTIVSSANSNNTEINIDIKGLCSGVYIVKSGNQIVKFVK